MKSKLYLKVYDELRSKIENGTYKYGERLISKRNIAEMYGVSIITVEHSLELLVEEGFIASRPRSGYYVIFNPGMSFFSKGEPGISSDTAADASYDLVSSNIKGSQSGSQMMTSRNKNDISSDDLSDIFPFSKYASSIRRVLNDYGKDILSKSDNTGNPVLKRSICSYLKRNRDINCEPEQIIVGSGAEYLYGLIVEMLGKDKIYGIEMPSYGKIEQVYRTKGANIVPLMLGSDGISSSELKKDFNVLHTTPYRSYPSNITASASKKQEYLNWQDKTGGIIIEDDFTSEFSPSLKSVDTIFSKSDHDMIYINTFSQTISPAARIAYIVLSRNLIEKYQSRVGFYSCTVSTLDQLVLADFIDNGYFERHLNRVRRLLRNQRG